MFWGYHSPWATLMIKIENDFLINGQCSVVEGTCGYPTNYHEHLDQLADFFYPRSKLSSFEKVVIYLKNAYLTRSIKRAIAMFQTRSGCTK